MKFYLLALVFLITTLKVVGQADYSIRINDTIINVVLDKPYNINVKGENVKFVINLKDTLTYSNSFFSFLYNKKHKVSQTQIEKGVDQITILTAEGSGILIQKYENLNPTALKELILTEVTKESINYGFKDTRTNFTKKLASGQETDVTKAFLTYKDEVNIYEIATIGKKDAGLIVVTIKMDNDATTDGQKVIDLMWASLKVN